MDPIVPPYSSIDLAPRLPHNLAPWARWFSESGAARGVDPWTLAAICARESGGGDYLEPKGPTGTGDGGNGLGLMQIDRRYWSTWAQLKDDAGECFLWQIPRYNIDKGAEVFQENLAYFRGNYPCSIAAYNASKDRVKHVLDGLGGDVSTDALVKALDPLTTEHSYVSWVLAHRHAYLSTSPTPNPGANHG